jgi:hypothetical protein
MMRQAFLHQASCALLGLWALLFLSACPFDGALLEGRRCVQDVECASFGARYVCEGGFCQDPGPECAVDADCPAPADVCQAVSCTSEGRCAVGAAPQGVACGPESGCAEGACDGQGACRMTLKDNACNDGSFCNGAERCDPGALGADGRGCTPGDLPTLDDGIACTVDTCDEGLGEVVHDNAGCACAGDEDCLGTACQPGACVERLCVFSAAPVGTGCDDGASCTEGDACDEAGRCVGAPGAACDDGLFCNGSERCSPEAQGADAESGCVAGAAPVVDDGIDCTADACDEAADMIAHDNRGCACARDEECVGICQVGACVEGACVFQAAPEGTGCTDGVRCTQDDTCDARGRCVGTPTDALCGNGRFCDGAEVCAPGRPGVDANGCNPGVAPDLNDGIACTADACDEERDLITHDPAACPCQRDADCLGEACQVGACVNFACVYSPAEVGAACDDGIDCTGNDRCDAQRRCAGLAEDARCADEDLCDGAEVCNPANQGADARGCVAGAPLEPDDGIACTADACDPATGELSHTPMNCECVAPSDCPARACQVASCERYACVYVVAAQGVSCDDDVDCTVEDACDGRGGCAGRADDGVCANGDLCDGVEVCNPVNQSADARGCVVGVSVVVDDGIDCTADACDPTTGFVSHVPQGDCGCAVDGDCVATCQVGDCVNFACVFAPMPVGARCDDGIECTLNDACDDQQRCQSGAPQDFLCQDGLVCNGAERCAPGEAGDPGDGCAAGDEPPPPVGLPECAVVACVEPDGVTVDYAACCEGVEQEGRYGEMACRDGLDNDCDQLTDAQDPDCDFVPTALPGLVLWLDASDLSTVDDGEPADNAQIDQWRDKSGLGNHANQESGARPRVQLNELNGRATVQFDGNDDKMVIANESRFDFSEQMTAVVVFRINTFDKRWQALLSKGDTTWRIHRNDNSQRMAFSTNDVLPNNLVTSNDPPKNVYQRILVDFNRGARRIFLDNTLNVSGEHGDDIDTNDNAVWLGANSGAGGREWEGFVAEVLVFNRALSDQERADLDAWLVRRWFP